MGKKTKPFSTCTDAMKQLVADVPAGNVRVYAVSSFPSGLPPFPEGYASKCSHFSVATSGAPEMGRDWMVICPHRVDGRPSTSTRRS